jgi:predicted DNA-binding protein with PD1-like motif
MQYLKTKNGLVIKLDAGEEIMSTLKNFVSDNKIKGGFLTGIGTGNEITLGFYDAEKRIYHKRFFPDDHEFASLIGNISYLDPAPIDNTRDDKTQGVRKNSAKPNNRCGVNADPVIHIHCTIGPLNFVTYSGHLFSAKVGATCEIMITLSDKKLIRKPDAKTGLNLLDLNLNTSK